MSIDVPRSDAEEAVLADAERAGRPYLTFRDAVGRLVVQPLDGDGPLAVGRREEAEVTLPWDRQVSRLHAELRRVGGEWVVADEGLSQNGTYVNEVRLLGRRRLADGDVVRAGRTHLTFRDPSPAAEGITPLPGELAATDAVSEQQRSVLRELCRPFAGDGEHVVPATDREIGARLGLPERIVEDELRALAEAFGLDRLPLGTARKQVARTALAEGIVTYEDLQ